MSKESNKNRAFKFKTPVKNDTKKPGKCYKYDGAVPIKTYELMRQGHELNAVAHIMGVAHNVFRRWVKLYPDLAYAVRKAKRFRKGEGVETFKEYIYDQLSPYVKNIWDQIMEFNVHIKETQDPDGYTFHKLSVLLEAQSKRMKQHLFIHAVIHTNFNISRSMKLVHIYYKTLKEWKEDPDFQALIEEINFHKGNFFESGLLGLVSQGDSAATIFANKTFNRKRGYNEKVDINLKLGEVNENSAGSALEQLSQLELSLDVRRELLQAIRKRKEQLANPTLQLEDKSKIVDAEFEVREKKKKRKESK